MEFDFVGIENGWLPQPLSGKRSYNSRRLRHNVPKPIHTLQAQNIMASQIIPYTWRIHMIFFHKIWQKIFFNSNRTLKSDRQLETGRISQDWDEFRTALAIQRPSRPPIALTLRIRSKSNLPNVPSDSLAAMLDNALSSTYSPTDKKSVHKDCEQRNSVGEERQTR